MTARYLFALALLALLSTAALFILQANIHAQERNAAVINAAGRQRMLSQRIALFSWQFVHAESQIQRDGVRHELLDAIHHMEDAHAALTVTDPAASLLVTPAPQVWAIYFEAPLQLDAKVRDYLSEARALVAAPDAELTPDNPRLHRLTTTSTELLDALDRVVEEYETESEAAVRRVERLDHAVFTVDLLVLVATGLFVFRPMTRRIRREVAALRALNETLEQRVEERTAIAEERARELVHSEQVLQAQTRILQSVLDSIGDGVVVADENGRFLLFNPAAEQILRLGPVDSPADKWAEQYGLYLPDGGTPYPPNEFPLARAIRGEAVDAAEMFMRRSDGIEGTWLSVTGRPVRDEDGALRGGVVVFRDFTARKVAEAKLQASEAELRALFAAMTDVILVLDAQGRYLKIAPTNPSLLHKPPDEIIGKTLHDVFPRLQADLFLAWILRALQEGRPVSIDYSLPIDGQEIWFAATIAPMSEDTAIWVARDTTERTRAEQALQESRRALATLMSNLPGLAYRCRNDIDWTMEFVSEGSLELTGYEPTDLIGNRTVAYGQLIHPDDRDRVWDDVQTALQENRSFRTVYRIITARAEEKWVWEQGRGIFDPDGGLQALEGFVTDMTERKRAEEALRVSEERFRALVQHSSDLITILDVDGIIRYESPSIERMLGFCPEELVGRSAFDLLHPDDLPIIRAALARLVQAPGTTLTEEGRFRHKAGAWRILEVTGTNLLDNPAVLGVVLNSHDVTVRREAETQIRILNAELEQRLVDLRRSNEELQQFAYVASHDLQEPLRMVASYLQLLERRYKGRLDSDADEFIAFAVDGATRMKQLINGLLAYSRVGTQGHPFVPVDCGVVLGHTLMTLQGAIRDYGAEVSHDPLPTVMGDETQLVQLFQNLVANALKFHGEEPPRVHVSARRRDTEWLFSVRDNGIGIERQYAERIFVIFQRLHGRSVYPGTGIGLAVCKKIVDRHGGRIWVESTSGEGATFYFTIPDRGEYS